MNLKDSSYNNSLNAICQTSKMILSETFYKTTSPGGVANAPPPATDRLTFQVFPSVPK